MNAFSDEWEKEKRRQSRIDAQMAVLPPHQAQRLENTKHKLEVALARVFGNRLDARVSARIVEGVVLDPACLCTIGGGVNELPTTQIGWDQFALDQAENEPLAKLSIYASDATLKERIRQEARDALSGPKRLAMARAGTLDEHLDRVVTEQIQDRAGV